MDAVSVSECSSGSVVYQARRENEITDIIDETFTTTEERFGELITIELRPGGGEVEVTEDNKKDYVKYVTIVFVQLRSPLNAYFTIAVWLNTALLSVFGSSLKHSCLDSQSSCRRT